MLRHILLAWRLARAIGELLRLQLHALLHVFGFAALMLAHELVVAFAFPALLLTLRFASLARVLGVFFQTFSARCLLALTLAFTQALKLLALLFALCLETVYLPFLLAHSLRLPLLFQQQHTLTFVDWSRI